MRENFNNFSLKSTLNVKYPKFYTHDVPKIAMSLKLIAESLNKISLSKLADKSDETDNVIYVVCEEKVYGKDISFSVSEGFAKRENVVQYIKRRKESHSPLSEWTKAGLELYFHDDIDLMGQYTVMTESEDIYYQLKIYKILVH